MNLKKLVWKFVDGKYNFEILFIISWIVYVYATVHWIRGLSTLIVLIQQSYDQKTKGPPDVTD